MNDTSEMLFSFCSIRDKLVSHEFMHYCLESHQDKNMTFDQYAIPLKNPNIIDNI